MQINDKNYKKDKIRSTLKKRAFLFFAISANQNSQNWISLEQNLHKLSLTYNKTSNNAALKIIQHSTFKNFRNIVNSTIFFLSPTEKAVIKNNVINTLNLVQVTCLLFKLNKKTHTILQLKKINSYNYKKNVKIMYQLCIATIKTLIRIEKKD